jgi:FkbM family methyltransferase
MLTARLKWLLRPLVFRLRRGGQSLGRLIRPPVKWDGRHHEHLLRFEPWSGEADGTFSYDFLGIKTDPRFRPQIRPQPKGAVKTILPSPHNAYFELIFLLDSLFAASGSKEFAFLEIGAGYGPWLVTAHRAAELSGGPAVNLVGVEMVPRHFEWMHDHMRHNGIDPAEHRLIHAAVSDRDGEALYQPERDMRLDYGQHVIKRQEGGFGEGGGSAGADGLEPVVVPCIALGRLLRDFDSIDLVHIDIQGEELRAINDGLDELCRRARRLIVATHSRRIHRELRSLLNDRGWECRYDFRMRKRERTEFGDVQFLDGLLAFLNRSRS